MSDIFSSARMRVRWAKEQLLEFKVLLSDLSKSNPYKRVVEPDPDGINEWHKVKVNPLPEKLTELATGIAENLRSALDQTGYATAVASGINKPRNAYFPMCRSTAEFENAIKQNCGDLPADIKALFRSYQAHPGGNKLLAALNALCGVSKHRLIKPLGTIIGDGRLTIRFEGPIGTKFDPGIPRWDAKKNEIVLLFAPAQCKPQYKVQIAILIVFDEVDLVGGKEIGPILERLCDEVSSVIDATEAESRRIGLIA